MNISSSAFEIYFDDVGAPGCGSSSSSAAGTPPKKGRGGGGGAAGQGRPPRCQVEGCNVDLSDAKSYYSRHKVCGKHSKSPKVIVSGIHQRFCQQCSRFHQLPEFDQEKRSCRRRLAGHNERRRKPPMGSLLSARYGSSTSFGNDSGGGGSFLMDFSTYPRHTRKDESGGQHPRSGKFPAIPWQNNSESPSPEIEHKTSCGHAIPSGGCFAGVSDSSTTQKALPLRLNIRSKAHKTTYPGHAIPSGGCFAEVSDSSCALSLLSNQSCDSRNQSLSFGANYLMNAYGSHVVQPAITHGPNIGQFSSNSWGFKGNEAAAVPYDMHPELGLGHISQPGNNQYTSDLPLTHQSGKQCMDLEDSMTYDSSAQHMRWSR